MSTTYQFHIYWFIFIFTHKEYQFMVDFVGILYIFCIFKQNLKTLYIIFIAQIYNIYAKLKSFNLKISMNTRKSPIASAKNFDVKVKRAPNAYNIFIREKMADYKINYPEITNQRIKMKVAAEEWQIHKLTS